MAFNKQAPIFNNDQINYKKNDEEEGTYLRQSSILSFQNLSIGDTTSMCASEYSHYNPSINEPFVSDNADPQERAMHEFLDLAGVFQINIKAQLQEEKKSAYSASPSIKKLSMTRNKPSPSFMERRRQRLLSTKDSTQGSSTGAKS